MRRFARWRCVLCGELEQASDAVAVFATADGLLFCAHPACQRSVRRGLGDTRDGQPVAEPAAVPR